MAYFKVSKQPYRFSVRVLLPMIICFLLLSCSYLKSCECYCPDPCYYDSADQRTHCSYSFKEMQLAVYPTNQVYYNDTSNLYFIHCGDDLSDNLNNSYPGFNFSSTGLLIPNFNFAIDRKPLWWVNNRDSSGSDRLVEASFDFNFSISIDGSADGQSNVGMLFVIISQSTPWAIGPCDTTSFPPLPNGTIPSIPARDSTIPGGSKVSVHVSPVPSNITLLLQWSYRNSIAINISIIAPGISSGTNNYNVSVKYNSGEHQLSVYVVDAVHGAEENQPADSPIVSVNNFNLSSFTSPNPFFGFFSTLEQLQNLKTLDKSFQNIPCSKKPSEITIVSLVVIIGSSVVVVASIAAAYCYFNSKYRRWKRDLDRLAQSIQRLPGVPTQVDFATIKKATNNFHESMELGRGGFGAVYRCRLPAPVTGEVLQEVAVKKFTRNDSQRYEDFLAEVSVINRLRHKNIVPLVGWSYHKGETLLIYEYMSNGSLDRHLFRNSRRTTPQQENMATLQWKTRYDIVRDIATGLHYIHHEHEPMVLHRDIKASNVMLDSNLRARLGDFGIACTVDLNKNSVSFYGKVLGTWGYIAPEYAKSCKATRQSDIYAFGVLVLEIVTGRRQWDEGKPDDEDITHWVLRLYRKGKLLETVDGSMVTAGDNNNQAVIADEAERVLLLGLACTHPNPSSRPSMVDVVQVITKLTSPPEVSPDRPTSPWLPTQDWRSQNSLYNTAATNLAGTSSTTLELVQVIQEQPSSTGAKRHVSFDDSAVASGSRGKNVTWSISEERQSTA